MATNDDTHETNTTLEQRAAQVQRALDCLGEAWRGDWSNFDGRTLRAQLDEIAGWLSGSTPLPKFHLWLEGMGIDPDTWTWK